MASSVRTEPESPRSSRSSAVSTKRDGGSIMWNGKDLPEVIRPEESRKLGINIIFQDNVLIPAFTGMGKYLSRKTVPGKRRADPMERDGTGSRGESGGAWDPS